VGWAQRDGKGPLGWRTPTTGRVHNVHKGQLAAVRAPTERRPGRVPHEVWAFLATDRPSRWLQVVLHYRGARGRIVTAFARRALPARPDGPRAAPATL
jgi:hypothetical protein